MCLRSYHEAFSESRTNMDDGQRSVGEGSERLVRPALGRKGNMVKSLLSYQKG